MYWVAEDGRTTRRRGGSATGRRQNDATPPPAGILKRSGHSTRAAAPFQFENGMVPQEMAAAVPMPSEQHVNDMFTEMVVR